MTPALNGSFLAEAYGSPLTAPSMEPLSPNAKSPLSPGDGRQRSERDSPSSPTTTSFPTEEDKSHHQATAASDRWRVVKDRQITFCSLFTILLMVVQNLVLYYKDEEASHHLNADGGTPHDWQDHFALGMELAIISLTACSISLISMYYRNLLKLKQREWAKGVISKGATAFQRAVRATQQNVQIDERSYRFFRSSLFPKFLLEVAIHLILPYPGVPRDKPLYNILQLSMFLRFYLLLRMMHTSSKPFLRRARINSYYADFRRMNLKIRWHLTLKMLFYDHAVAAVLIVLVFTLLMSGFCLFVLEREETPGFDNPEDCVWCAFVTMSTIGYGDMVPQTHAGKFVACLTGIMGHVITALFGGILTNKLVPSKTQQLISVFLDNQTAEVEFKGAAATLIQSVWRETRQLDRTLYALGTPQGRGGATAASMSVVKRPSEDRAIRSTMQKVLRVKNHKRNKVYAAVKIFRNRRHQVAKAQLTASDPVLEQKLDVITETLDGVLAVLKSNGSWPEDQSAGDDELDRSMLSRDPSMRRQSSVNSAAFSAQSGRRKPKAKAMRLFPTHSNDLLGGRRPSRGGVGGGGGGGGGGILAPKRSGKNENNSFKSVAVLSPTNLQQHNRVSRRDSEMDGVRPHHFNGITDVLCESDGASDENAPLQETSSSSDGWRRMGSEQRVVVSDVSPHLFAASAVTAVAAAAAARMAVRNAKAQKKRRIQTAATVTKENPLLRGVGGGGGGPGSGTTSGSLLGSHRNLRGGGEGGGGGGGGDDAPSTAVNFSFARVDSSSEVRRENPNTTAFLGKSDIQRLLMQDTTL